MPEYLAERYEPGTTAEQSGVEAARLAAAVRAMRRAGQSIDFLGVTFVPRDEASLAHFLGDSVDVVAAAHDRAGIRVDRIVEVLSVALPPDANGDA